MEIKPFVKWVGGKGQLLSQLDNYLPFDLEDWTDATYIEPFVGGGAMLFYMLQKYTNINNVVINDVNEDLMLCYKTVRDNPDGLIQSLKLLENEYKSLSSDEEKKLFFLKIRDRYNVKEHSDIDSTTMFFFLNRTCFNGLYRVNRKGEFNVPFGRYANPKICDPVTIKRDSELLQRVTILSGDFTSTLKYAKSKTLFYFDPPYRPLNSTSCFSEYTKDAFNDNAQIRLKQFCDVVSNAGFNFMLSNSDGKNNGKEDDFFDVLYKNYNIERVWASRNINSNADKRGRLTEILVYNYNLTRQNSCQLKLAK